MKTRYLPVGALLFGFLLPSCAPHKTTATQQPEISKHNKTATLPTPPLQADIRNEPPALIFTNPPSTAKHPLTAKSFSFRGIEFSVLSFDRRDYDLVVDDQPGGPGSEYDRAEDAGRGDLAAINAGFFTPKGDPLGLVITKGRKRGSINRASFLGTGFFLGPKAQLISRTEFLSAQPKPSELLQSGPRLLWAGETLTGLSDGDQRPRSFLLWDGGDHFAIGYANSASLKGLSNTLKSQPISGFKIAYALNLDGGRSSDLWVSPSVSGGGFSRNSFFNKDVRNYLVLKHRR